MGPPLGIGSPERRVSFPASFSHRSVGSSILASLSEAGGNDPRNQASKPLPPRFAFSPEPSTETHPTPTLNANVQPTLATDASALIYLQTNALQISRVALARTNLAPEFRIGTGPSPFRESWSVHPSFLVLYSVFSVPLRRYSVSFSHIFRPRTSVLNLPIPLRQWFFSKPRSHSPHDRALPSLVLLPARTRVVRFLRFSAPRVCSDSSRRHTWRHPLCFPRRLLLQLFSFQSENRLCKNVRTSPLRLSLVGHLVRQASRLFPAP
jgi:hypothetical protein